MRLIKLVFAFTLFIISANAQENLPVIKSNKAVISIRDGKTFKRSGWNLSPQAKPDVYKAELINGKSHKVTFITDVDSISFKVEEGKKYDFIIEWDGKPCYQQIIGTKFIPAAHFDKKYQRKHKGKISVEIPEVYELVNVVIAITPTGISNKNLVYQKSDYYKAMRAWFDKFRDHPLVAGIDAEIKKDFYAYFKLKMNGYSYEFDKRGKIVQSKIYDRTGFPGEALNHLRPFISQLQSFADSADFLRFYSENRKTYAAQETFLRDTANIPEMKRWLDKNFPSSNDYNSYKVIFSPLVGYNQSASWFESNNFKELHSHVNFPYREDLQVWFKDIQLTENAEIVIRGTTIFGEINHGYINPESDKLAEEIAKATSNRDRWVDVKMDKNYYPGISAFNEYMNWGLISLRILDYAPESEQQKLIAFIDNTMTRGRGFPQFEHFDKFLIDLYRNRAQGQTIADLYPKIIEWFASVNK
ncbi:MAG TPA: DUF4932 domain-containing protein [Chitinophagaceae bacterium]|nr:DUF4932 domain-containing protein [Chitinophagaceae bacterium]